MQPIDLLRKTPENAPLQVQVRPWPYCDVVLTNNHISDSNLGLEKKKIEHHSWSSGNFYWSHDFDKYSYFDSGTS